MHDFEIKNASIIDGLGNEAYQGNLYVKDKKISAITYGETLESKLSLNATGKVLTPGFIDLHSHSDFSFLLDPTAQSKIRQGVTLELMGNCGLSFCAPLKGDSKQQFDSWVSAYTDSFEVTWKDFAGYIDASKKSGATLNLAFQIGHGTIRSAVMGMVDRPPTSEELMEMKQLVGESLDAGALGFSTGLFYAPGFYSRTDEIISLTEEAGKRNKLYSTHQRDEGVSSVGLFVSLNEAIEIGRRAESKVQISHVKCHAPAVWGNSEKYLNLLEKANDEGLDIKGDQYPYTRSGTYLSGGVFPRWALDGGREKTLERMNDEETKGRIVDGINKIFRNERKAENIMIGRYVPDEGLEGKNLAEIAEVFKTSPAEAVLKIYEKGDAGIINLTMIDEDVNTFAQHPYIAVASDGVSLSTDGILSGGTPHPRSYGTIPRFIEKFVNSKKLIPLTEAIRKMTSLPAQRLGLTNRGRLTPGYAADLVILKAEKIKEKATFLNPHQYPEGIIDVIVNGEFVISDEKFTGKTPGMMITNFNA